MKTIRFLFVLAGLLASVVTASLGAISVVQGVGNGGLNTTSVAVTIATPGAGNGLCTLIGIGNNARTVSSVTGAGVTWSKASSSYNATDPTVEIWCGPNSSGSGTTVTVNTSGKGRTQAYVVEMSGVVTSSMVDAAGTGSTGTSTTPATGNVTTSTATAILLAGSAFAGVPAVTAGPTDSFTGLTTTNTSAAAYQIVSSTGTYSTSWTIDASEAWTGTIIAVKGTPPPATKPRLLTLGAGFAEEPDADHALKRFLELLFDPRPRWMRGR